MHTSADYISQGPLASSCGLASSAVKKDLAEWKRLGDFLIKNLGFPARAQLSDVQRCVPVPCLPIIASYAWFKAEQTKACEQTRL